MAGWAVCFVSGLFHLRSMSTADDVVDIADLHRRRDSYLAKRDQHVRLPLFPEMLSFILDLLLTYLSCDSPAYQSMSLSSITRRL